MYNLRPVLIEATIRRNVRTAYHGVYVTTLQTLWILPWALAGLKLNCFSTSSGKSQSEVMTNDMSQLDYHVNKCAYVLLWIKCILALQMQTFNTEKYFSA